MEGGRLAPEEFRRVVEHVARAGFDPNATRRVRQRHEGIAWKGRLLRTGQGQQLPTADEHYLTHVYVYGEWPQGMSEQGYLDSIGEVIRDPRSRFFVSLYQGQPHPTVVRRSYDLKGPEGHDYVLVDYRVRRGIG